MITPVTRWTKVRVSVFGVGFAVLFTLVARRAYRLQVGDESARLRGLAEEQYLREVELPPRRGRILDREGGELASTADVDSVFCNPRQLADPQAAARSLAKVLGMEPGKVNRIDLTLAPGVNKKKVREKVELAARGHGVQPGCAFSTAAATAAVAAARDPRRDRAARGQGDEAPRRVRRGPSR